MASIAQTSFSKEKPIEESERMELYKNYLEEARKIADKLQKEYNKNFSTFKDANMEELRFFNFLEN